MRISHITHVWPDGATVFDDLSLDLGPGRHGIVGRNGSGKSTLLRIFAGHCRVAEGAVTPSGSLAYLPQDPTAIGYLVAEVLGIAEVLQAICLIANGSLNPAHYDLIGADWDIEDRSRAVLGKLGLEKLDLDRPTESLSGGELVLLSLAALLVEEPETLLLDEPTNNLDRRARAHIFELVRGWRGTLIVASHDRELLELMDDITEVRDAGARVFVGPYSAYEATIEAEQLAARQTVRDAAADLRKQRRELIEAETKLAHRRRYGQKMFENKREPKMVMGLRKNSAQVSAGKLRNTHLDDVSKARERLRSAEADLREDRTIRLDLPATEVPKRREVLTTEGLRLAHVGLDVDLYISGPERIGLTGNNGSGKTTLLRTIAGLQQPAAGSVHRRVATRYVPQQLNLLDESLSVLENVRRAAPDTELNRVRAQLARLMFRGREAEKTAGMLSGGERLRAAFACVLLAEPAPQLLLLDEPANNLDLASTGHLVEALAAYRGALVVVSHDERFLDSLDLDRRFLLSSGEAGSAD